LVSQIPPEPLAFFGIVLALVSLGVALAGLIYLDKQVNAAKTQASTAKTALKLTQDELNKRLRPQIGRQDVELAGVITKSGFITIATWNKLWADRDAGIKVKIPKPIEAQCVFQMRNYGSLPALKVKIASRANTAVKPTVERAHFGIKYGVIMPGEVKPYRFNIPWINYISASKANPLHLVVQIEYLDESKKYWYSAYFTYDSEDLFVESEDLGKGLSV